MDPSESMQATHLSVQSTVHSGRYQEALTALNSIPEPLQSHFSSDSNLALSLGLLVPFSTPQDAEELLQTALKAQLGPEASLRVATDLPKRDEEAIAETVLDSEEAVVRHALLGWVAAKSELLSVAEAAIQESVKAGERLFPGSAGVALALCVAAEFAAEWSSRGEAERQYSESLRHCKVGIAGIAAYCGLGKLFSAEGSRNKAVEVYQEALELCRQPVWEAEVLVRLGHVHLKAKQFSEAETVLQKALQVCQSMTPLPGVTSSVLTSLGRLHIKSSRQQAKEDFQRALPLSQSRDHTVKALAGVRDCSTLLNQHSSALIANEEIAYISRLSFEVDSALYLLSRSRFDDAEALINETLSRELKDAQKAKALLVAGRILSASRKPAHSLFLQAVDVMQAKGRNSRMYGKCLYEAGVYFFASERFTEAEEFLLRAVQVYRSREDNQKAHLVSHTLYRLYVRSEQYSKAEEIVKTQPRTPKMLWDLAQLRELQQDADGAVELYSDALENNTALHLAVQTARDLGSLMTSQTHFKKAAKTYQTLALRCESDSHYAGKVKKLKQKIIDLESHEAQLEVWRTLKRTFTIDLSQYSDVIRSILVSLFRLADQLALSQSYSSFREMHRKMDQVFSQGIAMEESVSKVLRRVGDMMLKYQLMKYAAEVYLQALSDMNTGRLEFLLRRLIKHSILCAKEGRLTEAIAIRLKVLAVRRDYTAHTTKISLEKEVESLLQLQKRWQALEVLYVHNQFGVKSSWNFYYVRNLYRSSANR